MKQLFCVILMLIILINTSACSFSMEPMNYPQAKSGNIDLTDWSWEQDGIIPLDGEWEFQWFGSAEPKTMDSNRSNYIQVPGTWDNKVLANGQMIRNQGLGVYSLNIVNQQEGKRLSLRLPNIATAYELYIDDRLEMKRGVVGYDASSSTPYQLPGFVDFEPRTATTSLKLVVSNFDHRKGGLRTAILLGESEQIHRTDRNEISMRFIIIGCLIMIGFYHVGFYLLRRRDMKNLLFSLLCFFVVLRMGVMGDSFLIQWFPSLSWSGAIRMEYILFVLSGWAGYGYFHKMFPREIKRQGFTLFSVSAILLVLSIVVLPPLTFSSLIIVYQIYVLLIGFTILIGLVLARIRRLEGATLEMIGVAGFLFAIVNDMMFYNGIWGIRDLVPYGLLFLILMNSFIIFRRFAHTYERAELLTEQFKDWNNTLEKKIEERTEELHASYRTLEDAKLELERMELSRRLLVSNISHDLRTPITLLQGYLEALRDDVITEEQQRAATIRLMLKKVEVLNVLIQDLFELSVLEARKVDLNIEVLMLGEWKERMIELYSMEMEEKHIQFRCELEEDKIDNVRVSIDIHRMDRVFSNLLYNAIRFTQVGGTIEITFAFDPSDRVVKILLKDSGIGIHPEDLPFIFDRFYRKSDSKVKSSAGSGLGLAIAKEIVELHGGTIQARNAIEGGCIFEIHLPRLDDKEAG